MRFSKALIIFGVASALAVGANLFSARQAEAQSTRPYVVFVNGQGNCCAWEMKALQDRLIKQFNAEPLYVPYSNFRANGQSGGGNQYDWSSVDSQFLKDGENIINNQIDRNRPLILIGHSYGGDSILKLLPRLNRRIQFVAVLDPVSSGGLRSTLPSVPGNVDYFFNRWQENEPFPIDFIRNGSLQCSARRCDQEKQPFATDENFNVIRTQCGTLEFCRTKNKKIGHQSLPVDAGVQSWLGDRISEQLASFEPIVPPTPLTGIPISVNSGNTLFYDRSNGVCAFRASDGSVIQRLTSCRRSWHSIVYTANMLLFYDQDAGQIETYRVGSQGLAERLHTYAPNSMRKTWAQITSPSEGIIVFRDNNGQVETYRLNNIGMLQELERSVASSSLRSLQSFNFSGHFIRHANFFGYISVIDSNLSKNDATWSMVSGLANSQCSSFESKNFPGHYLRHQGFRIKIHQNDNTDLFKADATFCLRNGLADRSSFSFESLNFPNHYIRHRSSELWVDPQANDDLYKNDATFRIVNPFVQ